MGGMSLGAGLAAERLGGRLLPERLVIPLGLAALIVLGALALSNDLTAQLTYPLLIGAGIVGYLVPLEGRRRRPSPGMLVPALVVFAFYAAPTVLTGEATLLGFGKLDDPATFFGLLAHTTAHGHDISGLPRSSYKQVLGMFYAQGYPLGMLAPFGAGSKVVGQDLPWIFQPYIAFVAAMLALVLAEIARGLMGARAAVLAACGAALASLLYGYAMWGGVKEVSAAMLLALGAALVPLTAAWVREAELRAALPLALVCAAVIDGLTVGAVIWVAPLAGAAWLLWRRSAVRAPDASPAHRVDDQARVAFPFVHSMKDRPSGRVPRRGEALMGLGLGALLLAPAIAAAGSFGGSQHITVSGETKLGNLDGPLSWGQAFGVWPSRDFRFDPGAMTLTWVLIAAVGVLAAVGVATAWRARRWELPVLVGATGVGAVVLGLFASPWMAAKGLAIASPALLLAAFGGVAASWRGARPTVQLAPIRRTAAALAGTALAFGLLWSAALAYEGVTPAPRERLEELAKINERIAGEGPTLTPEYSSYADRYYLRDAAPEGPAEIRSREIPLRDGFELAKNGYADLDELDPRAVLRYRTIVMRHSPVASRPPSVYTRIWTGRDYEVWQRPPHSVGTVIAHLGLGAETEPAAVPSCARIMDLAGRAKAAGGTLIAFLRPEPTFALAAISDHPKAWSSGGLSALHPSGDGNLELGTTVPRAGRYELWLGGSADRGFATSVDGHRLDPVRYEPNPPGQYSPAGALWLDAGAHRVTLVRTADALHPGRAAGQPLTSVVLAPPEDRSRMTNVPPEEARTLCGGTFDWVEAVG